MKNSRFCRPATLLILLLFSSVFIQAKDQWIQVRSKNFFLIGNASEKDIRKVGTRLEQFRETFRLLFSSMNLTSSIPTNVVVFKSASSYKPFKPKRADGKIDEFIAGYFQGGEDVNYITLSTEGADDQLYGTIFHEYVHYIVDTNFGKSDVPPWFNEGLAEYYQTFEIVDDQKVKLGLAQSGHLQLLRQNRLIPLETFFNTTHSQLTQTGNHSRNIFYAQAWALVHHLIQGGKSDGLTRFLRAVLRNEPAQKAFQDAFQISYDQMEIELKKYVGQSQYQYNEVTLNKKLVYEDDIKVAPLDDAATNAYLGDLLYHIQRDADAEPYLLAALKLDPVSSMANTTLGMVKLKQRKFDDARNYLAKGISTDPKNHIAYYRYAYLLSRESQDEFGLSRPLSVETAGKMRDALRKAIALNPEFTESHDLLAFVSLVTGEGLDEALKAMEAAHKQQPGNQRYAMRIAEIHMRQSNFAEATAVADRIAKTTDDPDLRQRAELLARTIRDIEAFNAQRAAAGGRGSAGIGVMALGGTQTDPPMTNEEIARFGAETRMRTINERLRKAASDEKREIGRVYRIDCRSRPVHYTVKTATGTHTLTSKDFASLELGVFVEAVKKVQVGCDEKLATLNALITYRPLSGPKGSVRGELVALEFVPDDFRILNADEMRQPPPRIVSVDRIGPDGAALTGPPQPETADGARAKRDAILGAIRNALRQAVAGEKREIGYLDRIECGTKASYFHLRTAGGEAVKLLNPPNGPDIRVFTPDLAGMSFGCMTSPVEYPVVFIFKDAPDTKARTAGMLVSLDFVPKSFVLD